MSTIKNKKNRETKKYINNNNKKLLDSLDERTDIENKIVELNNFSNDKFIIKKISKTLNDIIKQSEEKQKKLKTILESNNKSPFFHNTIPKISIEKYLYRIKKYTDIEDSTFVISLMYIDILADKQKMVLSKFNIFRILFSAILIAVKYNEDKIFDNIFYSKIAGINIKKLNKLEYSFLKLIDFQLYVNDNLYELYFSDLKNLDE